MEKTPCCQPGMPLAIEVPIQGPCIPSNDSPILDGDEYVATPDPTKPSTKTEAFQQTSSDLEGGSGNEADQVNPNEVWWDSPNDPANPRNWSIASKLRQIILISAVCFIVPLASSIFAPGIPELMEEFGSTSGSLSSLVLSIYVLGINRRRHEELC
jgi:hypothetical protein